MANRCWRLALALACCAPAVGGDDTAASPQRKTSSSSQAQAPSPSEQAESTTPSASQSPTPGAETPTPPSPGPPPRLKIDIERAIAEAIARDPSLALPRFKEEVEVRDVYQDALEARLRGADLECGASESAPPTTLEMNPYRGATIPPHADLLAPAKLIGKALSGRFGSRKPRYFLYAVHRSADATNLAGPAASPSGGPSLPSAGPSAPTTADYLLRDAPISEADRSSVPGTSWELVARFRDRDSALAALDRLRRGFSTLRRAHEDGRLPPWVSTTCRPPRRKQP